MGDTLNRRGQQGFVPGGQFGPETTPFWTPTVDWQAPAPPLPAPDIFGGPTGRRRWGGCVEVGTPVEFPEGSRVEEEILPCRDWVALQVGERPAVNMHPDTLVSVWKRASELEIDDRVEVEDGNWEPVVGTTSFQRDGQKVKRTVTPGGVYHARGIRLHNFKYLPDPDSELPPRLLG